MTWQSTHRTLKHHCMCVCPVHSEQSHSHFTVKMCLILNWKKQNHQPPKHHPYHHHTQTDQDVSHAPDRLQTPQPHKGTWVCVCVLQEAKALYLAPMKTLAAEAVKPSTRYLVFKSFLTSLSTRSRPFMPLPLLSVIKGNLNPLIISPRKQSHKLVWSGFEKSSLVFPTKLFFAILVATQAYRASYFSAN